MACVESINGTEVAGYKIHVTSGSKMADFGKILICAGKNSNFENSKF